jgi:toxin ParE1/3/4
VEYQVVIGRLALRDMAKIREYIAKDNPAAASAFAERLLEEAESLRKFPERGGFIAERPGARFVIVHPYLVIYRIIAESGVVRVLRFWHGARERSRMRL